MPDIPEQATPGIGASIATFFADLGISGIFQPGIVKAIGHLMYGVADVPAAYLEGFADNIRSTTEARRHLRLEAARSLAGKFQTNSELAARAYSQHATKILKEQINAEDVLRISLEQLSTSQETAEPNGVPDDDWLAAFRNEAAQRSSGEMKLAFGKVLAGQIQMPGTYSIRTIRTLGMMDTQTAALFKTFCNMTLVVQGLDARVVTPSGDASQNALQEFGLVFSKLNVLQENGLIISDFNSKLSYSQFTRFPIPVSYAGRRVRLMPLEGMPNSSTIHGVALTSMGTELYSVVDLEENMKYSEKLVECFAGHKIGFHFS